MTHRKLIFSKRVGISIIGAFFFGFVPFASASDEYLVRLPLANINGFNMALVGAVGLGAVAYGLRNKATEEGDGGGGGVEAPSAADALAKIEDKTLTMGQRLQVATAALRGRDPTGQLASVKQSLTDVQTSLTAKEGELATLQAKVTNLEGQLAARETDLKALEESSAKLEKANKDLQAKEQDLETRASAMAKEQVAALGFSAAKLPAASSEIQAGSADEIMAEYHKLTDPKAKAEYYAAHVLPLMDGKKD